MIKIFDKQQKVRALVAVVVAVIVVGLGLSFWASRTSMKESGEYQIEAAQQTVAVSAEMRLLYAGTTFWGASYE